MFIAVAFLTIASISVVSFVVDPEQMYLKRYVMKQSLKSYVDAMVASEYGVVSAGPERQVKLELAISSDADCFVLGSSRSMQASLRGESWLSKACGSLANLGVSGGAFEDLMIYASSLAHKENKKIFLFIDPWSLSFEADKRWKENSDLYYYHMDSLGFSDFESSIVDTDKIFNLFNYDYALAAFGMLWSEGLEALPSLSGGFVELAPAFDYNSGFNKTVRLFDGSLVYSAEYIAGAIDRDINDGAYKEANIRVDKDAYPILQRTLNMLRDAGNEVEIVMPPYHPFVFSDSGNHHVQARIVDVEKNLLEIGEDLGISIRGGYNPSVSSCSYAEFYDSIHPTFSCIAKLPVVRP